MLGDYEGVPCKYTSPLQSLTASVPTVYQPGCADVLCGTAQIEDAKKIASTADAVVIIVGSDLSIETETVDRVNITLPGQQQTLVTEVAEVSKGPVILVIMSGGSMDVQFAKYNPKITSILWVGFPGEAGGAAIADVIFGNTIQVHNAPRKQLIGYQKLHLTPQAEGLIGFNIDVCKHLSIVDENGNQKVALGEYILHIGSLMHSLHVVI
ncbi:UNVERIFIED_CONTAM: Beta-xylosidase/alpha-L-arabinofuranosidase 1 [Sesamum radiatum]|uniref:Beta-xylosidase/alpha-L-arabinofuranosidase 1 n=1 Tax=Sesamum radiatum TaxID=300843 RepID=A0AAW2MU14_SESRA